MVWKSIKSRKGIRSIKRNISFGTFGTFVPFDTFKFMLVLYVE